jgi:2-methylisocitrate lyase-like PEP mutase family enzyme
MGHFEKFLQLHQQTSPLLLGNIWDVQSARMFEQNGYTAIGTSSQALANAFGYDDGENVPFELVLQLAKKSAESVKIPLSVDIEGGFAINIDDVVTNIKKLHDAGVAGINLEDSFAKPERRIMPAAEFRKRLFAITNQLTRENVRIFVNVRTDSFLLGMSDALSQSIARAQAYETAGANGIFVPCITKSKDIQAVVAATSLPINVMCMPALPDFNALQKLGVKRISMGPFVFNKVYEHMGALAQEISTNGSFTSIFSNL